jgi:integrase
VPAVSKPNYTALERFAPLKTEDYEDFKTDLLTWLKTSGKRPFRGDGYADSTIRTTHYKIEVAYRWLWDTREEYTTNYTPEEAEDYIDDLVRRSPKSDTEIEHHIKALKRLFKWFNDTRNSEYDWDYSKKAQLKSDQSGKSIHYFRAWELSDLYDASLEISSVRDYHNQEMSTEERDRIRAHLAQRMEIPKSEVGPQEFAEANSWKFPSLFSLSADLGLRPIEVGRANTGWLNLQDQEVRIPKQESTKNNDPWECALSTRSIRAIKRWLEERQSYELYDDTDKIWVTKYGNPYESGSLNSLLQRLLDETSIQANGRDLTWYAIRRGTATMWANDAGIEAAQAQLRHKNLQTTLRYVKSESSRRSQAANDLW